MNLRPRHTYGLFALAVVAVVGILAWLTTMTVGLDRDRAVAKHRAVVEENVRLALWRMDSSLASLLSEEGSRPHFVYQPMVSRRLALGSDPLLGMNRDDELVPSTLLTAPPSQVLLHFEYTPPSDLGLRGPGLSSPQVPSAAMAKRLPERVTPEALQVYAKRLEQLRPALPRIEKILAERQPPALADERLDPTAPPTPATILEALTEAPKNKKKLEKKQKYKKAKKAKKKPRPPQQQQDVYDSLVQTSKNVVEWGRRSSAVRKVSRYGKKRRKSANDMFYAPTRASTWKAPTAVEGAMAPAWVDDKLLLVRQVRDGSRTFAQGAWLNWPGIADELLADIADLFPDARLEPAKDLGSDGRRLAALPARLVIGATAPPPTGVSAPVLVTLVVAWGGAALAAFGLGLLMLGVTALSERRADFVSAVTHELRTPLTTFRMYTEMLGEGMVTDPDKRKQYLRTLQLESVRLGHLVENVLSYARIERGREGGQRERLALNEVIEHFAERLEDRASQAEMQLVVELPDDPDDLIVHADRGAVEQILYNLVDNATKYAASADDLRIHVHGERRGRFVHVSVFDHGPGIPRDVSRTLFSPFSKSAERAALSAPGVGLGLALSRRLARAMGGDLRHRPSPVGARFELKLPRT